MQYGFTDHFDPEKRYMPYSSSREELDDYLRLLDMVLEDYLRFKGLGSEDKLFSRGLVITESEMKSYFALPPYLRKQDQSDPELSAAVDEAWEYIEDRVNAGKTVIFISHHTKELLNVCDRVTVLRDGRAVGTHRVSEQ